MKPLYRKINSHFKLNGISFSHGELKEVAYSLIKEGEPFEKEIGDFLLDWLDDNPTLNVYTSGSTGKPKPLMIQKRHMVNSALATGEFFGLRSGHTALLCLPARYIAGKMMLVRAMVLGLELDCIMPSSEPIRSIPKFYDFGAMVPLQLENSLDVIGHFKTLIVGGASLAQKTHIQLQKLLETKEQKVSTKVYETYGMTETVTHIALKRVNVAGPGIKAAASDSVRSDSAEMPTNTGVPGGAGRQAYNPYFKTLPNVTLSQDERGCLVIDAPKIAAVPVVTNDVVVLISETEFEWLGRFDNVINSGGVKLFPEQIEAKLASAIPSRFFVAGLPDEKLGHKLVLFVEGKVEKEQLFKEIKNLKSLKRFEIPKEIRNVPEFRETESGKIRREATLALALQ